MSSIADFLSAIMGQESGGNYRAVNKNTGALGLYQVMPANVGPWARKYLNMKLTPQQFLSNSGLQQKLVGAVMSDYVRRYGYRGAASAWYSGNPALANNYGSQKYGPSIGSYVDSVMDKMGQGGFTQALTNISDTAHLFAQSTLQSSADFKQDPLEATQSILGSESTIPNPIAAGRDEPMAVKGLGLSIGDGIGQGQQGLEAPVGPTSLKGPPGFNDHVMAAEAPQGTPQRSDGMVMSGVNIGSGVGISNPLPGFHVTFGFGEKYAHSGHAAGAFHRGIDFAAPAGTRIMSPVGGRIVSAGYEKSGFGLAVRIQNNDGTFTILGHLSTLAGLQAGQTIRAGQFLGRVGSTGDADGAHLHMEMRRSLYNPDTAFDFTDNIEW